MLVGYRRYLGDFGNLRQPLRIFRLPQKVGKFLHHAELAPARLGLWLGMVWKKLGVVQNSAPILTTFFFSPNHAEVYQG